MAVDKKYGKIDIPGVPDDMPVFILLAKDYATVPTVEDYAVNADLVGASEGFCEQVNQVALDFRHWAADNADLMKAPD